MNFTESENYLFSLGNEVETMKLGLESVSTLLAALGDPQKNYLKVQVAGTNGKGSVCAFLDSICVRAGIKTGLYTSPHLISVRERIKIGGIDIGEADFAKYASRVREMAEALVCEKVLETIPTFFEQVTAIALLTFAEAEIELGILETGLGGRFDATTAANAEIAVITRIDLDHQEYLGDTIEEIAAEKAAIVREDSHVVVGRQSDRAMQVIIEHCRRVGAAVSSELYGPWTVNPIDSENVRVETTRLIYPKVVLGLKGIHQVENAETALNVVQSLKHEFGFDLGFDVEESGVFQVGLENARHPGRLEYLDGILLDGAHNVGGAKALRAYLDECVDKPITLVFGAMKGKNVAEIAKILFPRVDKIILTQPENERAFTAGELAAFVPLEIDADRIVRTETVADAIDKARKLTSADGTILVTGSLYLVGGVKSLLKRELAI